MPRFHIRTLMIASAVVAIGLWSVLSLGIPWPVPVLAVCALLGIGWRTWRTGELGTKGGSVGGALGGVVLALSIIAFRPHTTVRAALNGVVACALIGFVIGMMIESCVALVRVWVRNAATVRSYRRRP